MHVTAHRAKRAAAFSVNQLRAKSVFFVLYAIERGATRFVTVNVFV